MDEDLARKVVTKKQVGNPLNPFANPQTDQDDEEVNSYQTLLSTDASS